MRKKIEEPIRIAHIVGKWVGGGVEAVIMNYYRHIDRNKIQFDFLCDDDSTNIPYDEIEKLGGRVILVPPYQKVFKYHKELKRIFKENKYKIVHSHINTLSVFPLFAAKCAGVPVRIAHSHSTTNKKEFKRNILKQILRPFSKTFSTDYFACSESAGRWLFGDKEYDQGNVFILNNAIDYDFFKFDANIRKKIRKELGYNENDIIIGHVGRFVTTKNQLFIIDLLKRIEDNDERFKLLLIGQGPQLDTVRKKCIDYKIDSKVKFLGQRNDINDLYQAMDILVFPSLYEGLGMVLIEAQCSGLPCLSSEFVPKVSKINDNVFFLSLDDQSIWIDKILSLTTFRGQTREKMVLNNNDYNIDYAVCELEKKYNNLFVRR